MSSSSIHADPPPPIVTEPTGIDYATGPALGKGGFAICHRAERYEDCKPTGQIVALKIVKTKMEPAKLAQKFVTELQIHSKLSHPNVVTFYRAFAFQSSTYVVLELCSNGSLADMLKKRKFLTLPEIRRLVIQVCGAVKYLHCRHIVHRDLKTGNLFLDQNMNVKVGDFGLAALLVTEKEMEVRRRTTMCGTPNYLAPEILEKGKGHDEKVDLWALGVIAYTLAVGKAPFHASTKEEIYKKLRSGTYTWPELSATTNQSSDLRELVSSLLVPEEQRPLPDQIVSHSFFRIAYVPSSIPESARTRAPEWPAVTVPSPDIVRRGYSDTWYALCKESGVGEISPGNCFPLNRGRRIRSVVHDIAREEQLGRTPTMPIPKDVVYVSSVNDLDGKPAALQSSARGLKEIAHNEVATSRPRMQAEKIARDADMMPPPRIPGRTALTGSVRKAARTISEETAKSAETIKIASDIPAAPSSSATLRVGKTRPVPVASNSAPTVQLALKETNRPTTTPSTGYQTAKSYQDPDEKEPPAGTIKRSADASLARRPRGMTKLVKERAVSPIESLSVQPAAKPSARTVKERTKLSHADPGSRATLDELKDPLPHPPRYRKKAATPEIIEIHSDPESSSSKEDFPTTGALSLSRPPKMNRRLPQPQRRHTPGDLDPSLPGTDPNTVLTNLAIFRENLASALSKSSLAAKTSLSAHRHNSIHSLPFVSRWVDYSRKHGVGYVLSDGTVGCIINASSKPNTPATPVTHVLVRNGQRWLSRIGKDRAFSGIEQVPLEIFEDHGEAGVRRKVYKGLGSVKEGPLAVEAERRRVLSVLWVKFGRYMCQTLDDSGKREEESRPGEGEGNFVRFYQRIGSVGVWGFVDGCLQVHFPDHTKLVLSPSGLAVSATVLSTEAAAHLNTHGELLPTHVNSRTVLADDVHSLLFEGGRLRQRIVRANQMAEKFAFVKDIVGQWVGNGGLGRLDEDFDERRKISWEGMATKDARKVDRVCVGRYGGDAVAVDVLA